MSPCDGAVQGSSDRENPCIASGSCIRHPHCTRVHVPQAAARTAPQHARPPARDAVHDTSPAHSHTVPCPRPRPAPLLSSQRTTDCRLPTPVDDAWRGRGGCMRGGAPLRVRTRCAAARCASRADDARAVRPAKPPPPACPCISHRHKSPRAARHRPRRFKFHPHRPARRAVRVHPCARTRRRLGADADIRVRVGPAKNRSVRIYAGNRWRGCIRRARPGARGRDALPAPGGVLRGPRGVVRPAVDSVDGIPA